MGTLERGSKPGKPAPAAAAARRRAALPLVMPTPVALVVAVSSTARDLLQRLPLQRPHSMAQVGSKPLHLPPCCAVIDGGDICHKL